MTYTPNGGGAQNLVTGITYSGSGGAAKLPTGATVGNGTYTWALAYDPIARLTERKVQAGTTTLFDQMRSFDNVGNVQFINTTLQAGTDNQGFCYDQSDRLYWAGNHGTPGCGITVNAGTLTAAYYTMNASYNQLDQLTSGPAGSTYTYGGTQLDAVTSTSGGYTAAYDSAGNMTCRAPVGSGQTCLGTQTGQPMTYDNLRRLLTWQNAPSGATSTTSDAYNGEGERVAQVVTNGSTTTTTYYIGRYEEVTISGSTSTVTKYFGGGIVTEESNNGALSYLVNDDLGSISLALSTSGSVTAAALYSPYGTERYSSGTMPTSYGFTSQRLDASGLNYFHARYYDAAVGQFTSADYTQGTNRYGYVAGNPETKTDLSGTNTNPYAYDTYLYQVLLYRSVKKRHQATSDKGCKSERPPVEQTK